MVFQTGCWLDLLELWENLFQCIDDVLCRCLEVFIGGSPLCQLGMNIGLHSPFSCQLFVIGRGRISKALQGNNGFGKLVARERSGVLGFEI